MVSWTPGRLSSLGLIAGAICAYAVGLKYKLGYDDSLDVVGVHLVGGVIGAVSLGFIAAYPFLEQQSTGLFYGGGVQQLGLQILGPVAVGAYSFIITWIIAKIIDKTMGFRIGAEEEITASTSPPTPRPVTTSAPSTPRVWPPSTVRPPTPASKEVDA